MFRIQKVCPKEKIQKGKMTFSFLKNNSQTKVRTGFALYLLIIALNCENNFLSFNKFEPIFNLILFTFTFPKG